MYASVHYIEKCVSFITCFPVYFRIEDATYVLRIAIYKIFLVLLSANKYNDKKCD